MLIVGSEKWVYYSQSCGVFLGMRVSSDGLLTYKIH